MVLKGPFVYIFLLPSISYRKSLLRVYVDQGPLGEKCCYSWQVSVPKGSLCNLKVNVNVGLPPDAVYNIVIDPDNKKVFKNIKVSCITTF